MDNSDALMTSIIATQKQPTREMCNRVDMQTHAGRM